MVASGFCERANRKLRRCQSKQGDGGEGEGQGAVECWAARDQEVREEINRRVYDTGVGNWSLVPGHEDDAVYLCDTDVMKHISSRVGLLIGR